MATFEPNVSISSLTDTSLIFGGTAIVSDVQEVLNRWKLWFACAPADDLSQSITGTSIASGLEFVDDKPQMSWYDISVTGLTPNTEYVWEAHATPDDGLPTAATKIANGTFYTPHTLYCSLDFYNDGVLYYTQNVSDLVQYGLNYIPGVHFSVSQPTKSGFIFSGWQYSNDVYDNDGKKKSTGQYANWYGVESGTTHHRLDAVWKSPGCDCYVFDNGQWRPATPYIYDGSEWKQAALHIRDNNAWNPTP